MASAEKTPRQLAVARLAESGLSPNDARGFGIEFLDRRGPPALSAAFHPVVSLKLNYHKPSGAPTGFYRLRYLESPNGFDALTTKPARYVQPPKTAPEIYWPRSDVWAKIADNPAKPIHLTEGELKACCAMVNGFPTIAVGGVWSWRSAKSNEPITPTLTPAGFVWTERPVYIVFDSDLSVKPDVAMARLALCNALTSLGARPSLVNLPDTPGSKKTGLDDFLVAHGKQAYVDAVVNAEPFSNARELWQMNSEVVYVRDPGLIVVLADSRRLAPQAFTAHAFANRHFSEQQVKPDGGIKIVKKPLAKEWLAWPQRAELARMAYEPGEGRVTNDDAFNLWQKWGVEAKKGDVGPWTRLLDFLFGNDSAARTWFERWCAYPIQYPGIKLYTAAVLWGVVHGTGKSLVGYSLGKIYGTNFTEIGEEHLHATFNEWAQQKQFVLGDDITSGERRGQNSFIIEKLKNLITQQTLRVNTKFVPSFEVRDCINYYFTGNQPDLVFVEDTDRRYFIHEVVSAPQPLSFYKEYDAWLAGDGPAHLRYHLEHLPLGDFNPKASAPWTTAKRLMAIDNKSDLGAWVARLKETPDELLKLGESIVEGDLFTTAELLALYDPDKKGRVTANGLGRELKRAGFRYANDGITIATAHGPKRLYAIRNREQWIKSQPHAATESYNSRFATPSSTAAAKKKKEKF